MQAMQFLIFGMLKVILPGFIHSCTSVQLLDKIKSRIQPNWICISIDGRRFDSSQYGPLLEAVDTKFFNVFRDYVARIIENTY